MCSCPDRFAQENMAFLLSLNDYYSDRPTGGMKEKPQRIIKIKDGIWQTGA